MPTFRTLEGDLGDPRHRSSPDVKRCHVTFGLLVCAALASACSEDPFQQDVVPPPLLLRSTVPADSATIGQSDVAISFTFNRTVRDGEILTRIYPPPASTGDIVSVGSGRTVTWLDVHLDPESHAHSLLLTGNDIEEPHALLLFTGHPDSVGKFAGRIFSPEGYEEATVIFALDYWSSTFNPLAPTPPEPDQIRRLSLTRRRGPGVSDYAIGEVMPDSLYMVVAIRDTNHDARFDPRVDWWGFYGNQTTNEPDSVFAAARPERIRGNIDLPLRPPR
jgi:hypothetical protein